MSLDTLTVKKNFILYIHSLADNFSKSLIEEELPDVFPKGFIGKKGYPIDNSYCIHAVTGQPYNGIGPAGNWNTEASLVIVISEPYRLVVSGVEKEFITALFKGEPYRILNYIENSPRPIRKSWCMDFGYGIV